MTRAEILEQAKTCVTGQREQDYGSPEDNFNAIASLWEPYIRARCVSPGYDVCVTGNDVANLMMLFKIGRIMTGTGTDDCYVDIAGYAACGGEIANKHE